MTAQIIKSACRGCHGGCGVLVKVEDNRVIKIKGNLDSPINRGKLCVKGQLYHTITHHPLAPDPADCARKTEPSSLLAGRRPMRISAGNF